MKWLCFFGRHDWKTTARFPITVQGTRLLKYDFSEEQTVVVQKCKRCGNNRAFAITLNGYNRNVSIHQARLWMKGMPDEYKVENKC